MTPQTMIARLDAALALTGESVILRHTAIDMATGAETVLDEMTCPAQVRAYAPQDLAAGDIQSIRVTVSPTSGIEAFEPKKDDRIVISGNLSNIAQIGPIYYGGRLVRMNLLCRG